VTSATGTAVFKPDPLGALTVGTLHRLLGVDRAVLADRPFRVLLVASLISPLGTAVVSPVLASLTGPFGVTEARAGFLLAAFTAPSIVLIPVVGALSDRVGRRPVLAGALALFGLAGSAVALTTDFRVALALRALQGVGYCGIAPVLITSVGDLYAGEREAAAQGVRFTVVGVALTLAPLVAGLLVALAWQAPFLVYLLALPASLAVALFLGDPRDRGSDGPPAPAESLLALARRPRVLATLAGLTAPRLVWFAFLTYASVVVTRLLGSTPAVAGAVVAAASLGAALAATQVGRLTGAAGRTGPLVGSVAASGLGLVGVAVAPSVPVAAVGAFVAGAGFGVNVSLYRSEMTRLAPAARRGGLVSVGESVGRVGSTVAPVLAGALVAAGRTTLGDGGAVRGALVAMAVLAVVVGAAGSVAAGRFAAPPGSPAAD
jgi:MFS family permease